MGLTLLVRKDILVHGDKIVTIKLARPNWRNTNNVQLYAVVFV